ncbi:Eukaryotic initiation factor 4A-I-like protein [Dinothrombium tinctorium]|uniref:ATP-dependent RNA helicase n=1 Tax=Dinothrombium tinctorium TaxID=1965070 RepID=A0A3S3PBP3_9ACAR|nr:Eukaryotic initiation factor 4A-I-like protein [Dinothrombium tinctorium]RWS02101.1 Eukaryotic initiation factor 4A-I-like protein [Dinothrombium tinctorium]RWS05267.1 Eukaryotic initiation factor 4A-I-like protein [Dinothrombium tinctorium]
MLLPCLKGYDVFVQSRHKTGKKVASLISVLQKIDVAISECQALILVSFREKAEEIQKMISQLLYSSVKCQKCIGGTNIDEDIKMLSLGAHIVVGTSGRVYDLIRKKALRTGEIKILVLDEAEKMFSCCASDQISDIIKTFSYELQIIILSTRISAELTEGAKKLMRDPVKIVTKNENYERIKQYFVCAEEMDMKFKTLCELFKTFRIDKAVIFCNLLSRVDSLNVKMKQKNFNFNCLVSIDIL